MKFTNETFADEVTNLDDDSFIDCNIVQCDIVYEGTGRGVLANCIIESPRFSFTGAAARTLDPRNHQHHKNSKEIKCMLPAVT